MIGQKLLIKQFNNFSINTLPHAILLVGNYGCGKHEFCKWVSAKFSLTLNIIDDKINYDLIINLNNLTEPTLCVFDSKNITIKEEAVLLKFIEEPKQNIFIAILSESPNYVLDTILNRCQLFKFEPYTQEELFQFLNTSNASILNVADTPGKVKLWDNFNFDNTLNYCNMIFDKIKLASLSNILTITNKIDFESKNDDLAKYDLDFFCAVLHYCIKNRVIKNYPNAMSQYLITNKFINNLNILHINKKQLFEHYLYELQGDN